MAALRKIRSPNKEEADYDRLMRKIRLDDLKYVMKPQLLLLMKQRVQIASSAALGSVSATQ